MKRKLKRKWARWKTFCPSLTWIIWKNKPKITNSCALPIHFLRNDQGLCRCCWGVEIRGGNQQTLMTNSEMCFDKLVQLTSTVLMQYGHSTLQASPSLGNNPSTHSLQKEWRHGRTLGSLYCSKQIAHSNSFLNFSAEDETLAIVSMYLFEQK